MQRIVQILKRHRDVMFKDDKDKPISIIITTLAANAYKGEDSLLEGLVNVISCMEPTIKDKNGKSVGQGSFFGDYYVPYDGSITVQYEYYCNYYSYSTGGCEKWYPDSFEIAVSSAQSLEVKIVAQDEHYGLHTYFVIYVNGAIWKTIEH